MCGICGILHFDEQKNVDISILKKMCDAMIYRGPDDEGTYIQNGEKNKNIGLGMRRLSIIDLQTGHQPIHNENKSIWTICNGEIYNFPELKNDLEIKGHKFYTNSDTEVIVHLYEQYGLDFVKKLNGMFAIALWDENNKKLVLARDIFGIKPLLYFLNSDGIVFSSEINSLLASNMIKKEINTEAMDNYFSFYFTCSPETMFKSIKKIPAAHMMVFHGKENKLIKYWEPKFLIYENFSEKYYTEKLYETINGAIKRQLISDVPLGVFLSGGLDSTTIVAMMSKLNVSAIKTFSISFDDKSFDESEDAKLVADMYKTQHKDIKVGPDVYIKYLPKLIHHLGEPNGDWTSALELCLSEFAKKEVTVILSGTGGDEILAGYPTITAYKLAKIYKKFPKLFRSLTNNIVNKLPVSMSNISFDYKAKRFASGTELELLRAHMYWKEIFTEDEKEKLYSKDFKSNLSNYNSFSVFERYSNELPDKTDPTNLLLYVDSRTFLGDCLLPHVDASSMATSLEVRVPFLDKELVEFAETIPVHLKHNKLTTKYLFRKTVKDLLPKRIIKKKKMGFSAPLSKWIKKDLYNFSRETVLDSNLMKSGFLNKNYISEIFDSHTKNKKDSGRQIQALVSLALWYNEFIVTGNPSTPSSRSGQVL
ncbi:MAG: asparagine synthase (glutamine-hydrolyzing) [Elusimicrobia bacterium RIFOXYD2_FULL_34_15]|nr:MAG: asparagine synthase (glutamine-hydrolyzing) [Elusimicrobia bacterium RIFOXYD2_FULL_34_15]